MEKLQLYRSLMKLCRKFENYTFREYFLRRTREDFRQTSWSIESGQNYQSMLQRQATLQSLYPSEKLVIELKEPPRLGIQAN